MSGSSRVVLDSDEEDELEPELDISTEFEHAASDGAFEATVSSVASEGDSSNLPGLMNDCQNAFDHEAQSLKRAASEAPELERGRLKRPKSMPEPQSRQYVDDPYDGSQAASQPQQPTESQLKDVYHEVIAEPSSTVMDSATPRPLHADDDDTVAPADLQLGNGDITFEAEDDSLTPIRSYMTPMTSTSHQTSWNHNTMRVPVVLIPGPPQGYAKDVRPNVRREPSPDELSVDPPVDLPKEMYRPRPSRSRSVHPDPKVKEVGSHEETYSKRSRRASAGATMQQHQESLVGMGFRASQAEIALQVTGGNLDQAVNWLCPERSEHAVNDTSNDAHEEAMSANKESTPDTVSTASQVEPEPEHEPSAKKRKATAKKKAPAKKKQRKKAIAEDVETHQEQAVAMESADAPPKQEDVTAKHDDLDDDEEEPPKIPGRKGRGRDKQAAAQAVVLEEPGDELAEASPARDDDKAEHLTTKEIPPPKPAKRGRGRPKKAAITVAISVEHDEEVDEGKDIDEPEAEAAAAEPMIAADKVSRGIDADKEESKVLAEKDANASAPEGKMADADVKPKAETPAAPVKRSLGEENLVRATPPLRLNSGPVHRVGLSRRRPIQSLLRIIKR